jgi:hypothetical protein
VKILLPTLTALVIGFLALTKIIFGYVLLVMLIIYLISLLSRNNRRENRFGALIIFGALLINIPYLIYTTLKFSTTTFLYICSLVFLLAIICSLVYLLVI